MQSSIINVVPAFISSKEHAILIITDLCLWLRDFSSFFKRQKWTFFTSQIQETTAIIFQGF